jgi:hypothetical protein
MKDISPRRKRIPNLYGSKYEVKIRFSASECFSFFISEVYGVLKRSNSLTGSIRRRDRQSWEKLIWTIWNRDISIKLKKRNLFREFHRLVHYLFRPFRFRQPDTVDFSRRYSLLLCFNQFLDASSRSLILFLRYEQVPNFSFFSEKAQNRLPAFFASFHSWKSRYLNQC